MNTSAHPHGNTEDALHCIETTLPSRGSLLPAFLAKPAHPVEATFPIILVVHEIFGINDYIRTLCRRLAAAGYLAIAPDLYFRHGSPDDFSDIQQLKKTLVSQVADREVLADLDHAANWAASHGGDLRRLGLTGFCWGGRIAWLYAAHNPQLQAAVAWYGHLHPQITLRQPVTPVDAAASLSAPVLGLYGASDPMISQETIALMQQALRAANSDSEIITYPDAGHAFHADYRPDYHEASALDGWQRMLAWFSRYHVTPDRQQPRL